MMGTGKRSSLVVPYNFNTDDLQPDDINKACDDRLSEVNRTEYFQKLMALLQKVPKATVASESNDTALMTVQNASRSFKRDSAFVPEIASAFAKQKKLSFPSSEDSHLVQLRLAYFYQKLLSVVFSLYFSGLLLVLRKDY